MLKKLLAAVVLAALLVSPLAWLLLCDGEGESDHSETTRLSSRGATDNFPRFALAPFVGATIGGRTAPDGAEIHIDLPGDLHRRNTASRGLGNCVFTSIHHAALWQNVAALQEFPGWLIQKGIPGGGYPQKVDDLIKKICKDRSLPVPLYLNVEGRDTGILKAACKSGRMPSVTYGFSPTNRYGGRKISHMVNLAHADDKYFCVLDNNYPGADAYEWMSEGEFLRTFTDTSGSGWAVVLLAPPPPPAPKNAR